MVYTWYIPGIYRISEYTWYIHVYTDYLPRRGSRCTIMSKNYDTHLKLGTVTVHDFFIMFEHVLRHPPWLYTVWWSQKMKKQCEEKVFG